jgi:hypothetical protein
MTDEPKKFEDWLIRIFKDADRKWDSLREFFRKQWASEGIKAEEMKTKWEEKKKTLENDPNFKGVFEKLTEEGKKQMSLEGIKPDEIEKQLKDFTKDFTEVSIIRLLFEQMKKDLPKDENCLA